MVQGVAAATIAWLLAQLLTCPPSKLSTPTTVGTSSSNGPSSSSSVMSRGGRPATMTRVPAERSQGLRGDRPVAGLPGWLGTARARHLLLGDWNPIIRDPIDVLRAALLVGSVLLIVFDKNVEAAPLVTVLIVLIPRLANLPRLFDLAVVVAMSIQAWGNLFDLFDRIHGYDKVVHFLVPMLTSTATYMLLVRLDVVLDPARRVLARQELGTFLITFLIGLGYASLYEIYEFFADAVLGTELQKSLGDTNGDILAGAIGAACGGWLMLLWTHQGWPVTRRLPTDVINRMWPLVDERPLRDRPPTG